MFRRFLKTGAAIVGLATALLAIGWALQLQTWVPALAGLPGIVLAVWLRGGVYDYDARLRKVWDANGLTSVLKDVNAEGKTVVRRLRPKVIDTHRNKAEDCLEVTVRVDTGKPVSEVVAARDAIQDVLNAPYLRVSVDPRYRNLVTLAVYRRDPLDTDLPINPALELPVGW